MIKIYDADDKMILVGLKQLQMTKLVSDTSTSKPPDIIIKMLE